MPRSSPSRIVFTVFTPRHHFGQSSTRVIACHTGSTGDEVCQTVMNVYFICATSVSTGCDTQAAIVRLGYHTPQNDSCTLTERRPSGAVFPLRCKIEPHLAID